MFPTPRCSRLSIASVEFVLSPRCPRCQEHLHYEEQSLHYRRCGHCLGRNHGIGKCCRNPYLKQHRNVRHLDAQQHLQPAKASVCAARRDPHDRTRHDHREHHQHRRKHRCLPWREDHCARYAARPNHFHIEGRRRDVDERKPQNRHLAHRSERVGKPHDHGSRVHLRFASCWQHEVTKRDESRRDGRTCR